jgi:hypothetical protein
MTDNLPRTPLDVTHYREPTRHRGRVFDRQIQFDARSLDYPVATYLAGKGFTYPRSYTWGSDVVTDQGSEGACVGHAFAGELAARPKEVEGIDNTFAFALYREAQNHDGFPDDVPGTTVLAGVKAVQARGHMPEYRWAFHIDDLAIAVSRHGPAVLGIPWKFGMYEPVLGDDGRHWVNVTGPVVGGHAILAVGYNVNARAFCLQNSWGPGWGDNGRAWIDHDTLGTLLADMGEACIPIKR